MNTITIVTLFTTLWLVLWKQHMTELLHNQLIFRTVNYLDMKSCLLKKLFLNAKYLQAERLESQVFIQTRSDVQPIEMLGWSPVSILCSYSSQDFIELVPGSKNVTVSLLILSKQRSFVAISSSSAGLASAKRESPPLQTFWWTQRGRRHLEKNWPVVDVVVVAVVATWWCHRSDISLLQQECAHVFSCPLFRRSRSEPSSFFGPGRLAGESCKLGWSEV